MAIKQEMWDKAKVMFEAGKTLSDIQHKTGINFSTIGKKAKKEGWNKGVNSTIINNEVSVLAAKSQLNPNELEFHDAEVAKKTKHLLFIQNASLKNVQVMLKKVDEQTLHQEHKFVQETINKAGEALGVIDKNNGTNVNIQNTNAQQTVLEIHDTLKALEKNGLPVPILHE